MTATVTALKPSRAKPKTATPASSPPTRSAAWKRKMRRQRGTSYATAGVALVLMGLSLSHLAAGIGALTHSDPAHAWSMAVGIDLGFIALEVGQLCATSESIRAKIMQWAGPTIIGTLTVSAAMNAYAFASVVVGWPVVLSACTLGVSIPMLIYVLTRVSVALWVDAARS